MRSNTVRFPNLTRLEVKDLAHRHDRLPRTPLKNERSLAALIKRHQSSLKEFTSNSDTKDSVLEALSGCPKLEKLKLRYRYFEEEKDWLKWYKRLWSRLESLSWEGIVEYESTSDDVRVVSEVLAQFSHVGPTTIKDLHLGDGHRMRMVELTHVLLLMKSPELVRLRWDVDRDMVDILARIAEMVPFGQHLKDMRLYSPDMTGKDFRKLFSKLPKLERFEVRHGALTMDAFRALQTETPQFLTTLKVLRLGRGGGDHTGELAHAILTSIPGLEEFSTDYITDIDIREGGGRWVCTGLRRLKIGIVLLEEGTQDMVLDLLASLKNLISLDLTKPDLFRVTFPTLPAGSDMSSSYSPRLTLDRGLDRLKVLHRLASFAAPRGCTPWTEAEAHWALRHWPRLRFIRGIGIDSKVLDLLQPDIQVFPL
ncbi:hypothetical protein EMPS_07134 [Entomortierella parvispora]|uniref:F-box domain-containing protein n=1 Tax=Entomortierella parvispora TaxID=205924 RepID=A0A9P3HDV0_9FUNG|nr:hypothetical protein EMPS_07134 [Entomortierella parvispora]